MLGKMTAGVTGFTRNAVNSHLEWICRTTRAWPLRVIGCALLILVLAFLSIRTVRFESDIFRLFPSSEGPLKLFLDSLKWTGGAAEAYFLLEGDREKVVSEAETFAARLKALSVDGAPAFRKVSYRVYDPAEAGSFADFIAYAVSHPHLFLPPDEVGRFAEKLTPQAMDRSLQRAGSELASQAGTGMRDIIAADPLYLRDLILPRLKGAAQAFDLDPDSPYFLSRDGQVLIMVAETAKPVQDMDFARKLVRGINEARKGFSSKISCAGAHLSAVIDEQVMKRNILACVGSSLLVVLGLFYVTYRRFLPTLLIPLIILYGTVLALGIGGLLLASVNIISLAFTALIIGLGTDYSIHLYDRFYHERSTGKGVDEALRCAVVDTGHGLFTAGVTTALPFLVLTISDVRALSELGLLVGLGVLFSLYATLFFLPPLLVFAERRFPARRYKPLPGFALGSVWSFAGRHPGRIAFLSLFLVAGLLVSSFFVSFEGELKNLQPRHSEAFLTQEKIERHLSLGRKQLLLAVEGKSLHDVMSREERIVPIIEEYLRKKELTAWSSLEKVVNDRGLAGEVRQSISAAVGPGEPAWVLRTTLERNGFDPEQFHQTLQGVAGLKKGMSVSTEEAVDRLEKSPLRGVVERHLVRNGGNFHLLSYLYYSGEEFNQAAFLSEMNRLDPAIRATSVDLVSNQLADLVKKSFLWGFAIGGVLVLFLLLAHFENMAGMFYSLFPVVAGVIAMLGIMALTGMRLNFMNSMVLVTILGMGSDYGLHIMHRVRGAREFEAQAEFVQSGRAVLLSALTTIAGFGSLAFTDYGAMSSIGWATNYGIGATVLLALVTVPAFMCLLGRKNQVCRKGAETRSNISGLETEGLSSRRDRGVRDESIPQGD
jgi:predicted RND superfamily exporter protein